MKRISCNVCLSNVMKEPNHRAELHTQFLFGDKATIVDEFNNSWVKVVSENQQTTGWVLRSQFDECDSETIGSEQYMVLGYFSYIIKNNELFPVVTGTYISAEDEVCQLRSEEKVEISSIVFEDEFKRRILDSYLNAPYMWGGTSIYGIDCSGLSKMFYKFFGIHLPHFAATQMQSGEVLDFLSNAVCGDLAFFENEDNEINHVGILLNDHEIIHASETNGRVMIDHIDHEGIVNKRTGKRTHQLRLIKRLL